jgi:hypothetical protein
LSEPSYGDDKIAKRDEIHSSLFFAGSYFTVTQICVVVPITRIHHSGPAADRNMKIVRQLEQVFERYRMMFKKLKEEKKKKTAHLTVFLQTKKNTKKL